MKCKKFIMGGAVLGFLLMIVFPPIFGGAGNDVVAAIYTILIFPLHGFGLLFWLLSGKAVGEVPFGLLLLLFTMPITYGFCGAVLCWGLRRMQRMRRAKVAKVAKDDSSNK